MQNMGHTRIPLKERKRVTDRFPLLYALHRTFAMTDLTDRDVLIGQGESVVQFRSLQRI